MAWWMGAGALLGGLAGSQGDKASSGLDVGQASQLETAGTNAMQSGLDQFGQMVAAGPGQTDVLNASANSTKLQEMLKQYASGGYLPTEADFTTANQFTTQAFKPQQVAMDQAFTGQQERAAQLAARLGRPVNDPVIQNMLSKEYMQGQERMGAEMSAASSQLALQMPQQRLGYTAQLADVSNALASQAMSNRSALLSLGQQVQQSERNWRLNTATRTQESGGGIGGMINGAIAGAGAFANIGNMFSKTKPTPSATPTASSAPYGPQTAAQAGYTAPLAAQIPSFSQSLSSTGLFSNTTPLALQPSNAMNSMVSPALQFNAFGMMTPGGQTYNAPNFSLFRQ